MISISSIKLGIALFGLLVSGMGIATASAWPRVMPTKAAWKLMLMSIGCLALDIVFILLFL